MRLNVFLARAGVASRRGADELIKAGKVKVNGGVGQLNSEVTDQDIVELGGQRVGLQNLRYILLYKPAGIVTTLKDPEDRRKVTDLIDIPERVVPVGRLDYDTIGALLLTNDGQLAHKLMHPSFEIDKVYQAEVEGQVTAEKLRKLEKGIELDDSQTAPAKARLLEGTTLRPEGRTLLEITLHEGRKHQVKRMLAAVGLPVKTLHRSKYGPLDLKNLRPGQWRNLTTKEIQLLKSD